jgi:signal transduction histidine kinase
LVINEAITSIKEISNNLSPHVLSNFGLVSALKNFAHKINQTKAVRIDLTSNMENERFDHNVEIILYRASCELINNTIKHAAAENIQINISKHLRTLTIQYHDDGIGFQPEKIMNNQTDGTGFSNIQSRIKSIHGIFILNSVPNEGTTALIKVKLNG